MVEQRIASQRAEGIRPRATQFPHGADIGVRGVGATRATAFEQAALALASAVTNVGKVRLAESVEIQCEPPDDRILLADWLNRPAASASTYPAACAPW